MATPTTSAPTIDATEHLPAKLTVMRAHRSQMHPDGWSGAVNATRKPDRPWR